MIEQPSVQEQSATGDMLPPRLALAYKYEAENQHVAYERKQVAAKKQRELSIDDAEKEEMERQFEIVRACGLVFRTVDLSSDEAAKEPGVQKAIDKEFETIHQKLKVFNIKNVREWDQVRTMCPKARKCATRFVVGEKGVELDVDDEGRYYKARLCAIGCNVKDSRGSRIAQHLSHVIPASLCAVRTCEMHAAQYPTGITADGDAENAYCKAPMDNRDGGTWVTLPKECRPAWWDRVFSCPVVLLDFSLYGLQISGLNWGEKVRKDLTVSLGWEWVRDVGETSMYYRTIPHSTARLLLVVFTDDFRIGGPAKAVWAAYVELDAHFGFSDKSKANPRGGKFAGVETEYLPAPIGTTRLKIHQTRYCLMMVDKLEKKLGCSLKVFNTPLKERRDARDDVLRQTLGTLYDMAPELAGQSYWVARGARPECMMSVHKIAKRLRQWTREEDEIVLRLYGFLKQFPDLGVIYEINHEEAARGELMQLDFADSDHVGEEELHTKSTSGWAVCIAGPKSWATLDWGIKTQTGTAYSTPDAELASQAHMVMRSAAAINTMLMQVWGRVVFERALTDNAACLSIVRAGYSKALGYMRKLQKVSVGLLADYFADEHTDIDGVSTTLQGADLFTKGFGVQTFWYLLKLLRIGAK